jgi:hypothetical protein
MPTSVQVLTFKEMQEKVHVFLQVVEQQKPRTPRDLNVPSAELRSSAKLLAQKYVNNDDGTADHINEFMQAFKASPPGEQFYQPRYNMNNPQNA